MRLIGSVSEISGVVPAHTTMNRTSSLENRWDHNGLHCFVGVFVMVLLGTVFTFRLGIFFHFISCLHYLILNQPHQKHNTGTLYHHSVEVKLFSIHMESGFCPPVGINPIFTKTVS